MTLKYRFLAHVPKYGARVVSRCVLHYYVSLCVCVCFVGVLLSVPPASESTMSSQRPPHQKQMLDTGNVCIVHVSTREARLFFLLQFQVVQFYYRLPFLKLLRFHFLIAALFYYSCLSGPTSVSICGCTILNYQFSVLSAQLSLLSSHFSLHTSHFALLTSHCILLTSEFRVLTTR